MYQPASEVIHLEHQTYSEYAEAKRTTLQRHNTAIFLEKWQADLQSAYPQHSPIHLMMSHAERARPMPSTNNKLNILYFSPFPSHPTSHGNRATIYQYARNFQSMGHKVHFVLLKNRDQYTQTDLDDMSEAWDTFDEIPYGDSTGIDPTGIPFDGWYQEGLGECIRQLCAQYNIDIVFCSYVFQSKLLEYVPEYMVKVIDTHDKMGNRYEMLRANGQPLEFFSCSPEEEGAYLRRADLVIARRQEEADYFDSVTGLQSAIVVPHVEPPVFLTKNFMQLNSVGVVASANRINLALVLEFLQTIDRYLTDSICPFTVHVAGEVKNMVSDLPKKDADVFNRPWVKMHGFVPEIADFYQSMDLIVSPVTMGTGINVKTVQAMAYGMPLLTTVCGSKGIETSNIAHNHEKLDTLVEQLFSLSGSESVNKEELDRLATLSRERYHEFYSKSVHAMHALFDHPKIHCYRVHD
jgi:glycosyltransferase involved in cell wall biosynthesis